MGKGSSHAGPALVGAGKAQIHAVPVICFLVPTLCRFLYEQGIILAGVCFKDAGKFALAVGHLCLAVIGGDAAGLLRYLGITCAKVNKYCILGLIAVEAPEIPGLQGVGLGELPGDTVLAVEAHKVQAAAFPKAAGHGGLGTG